MRFGPPSFGASGHSSTSRPTRATVMPRPGSGLSRRPGNRRNLHPNSTSISCQKGLAVGIAFIRRSYQPLPVISACRPRFSWQTQANPAAGGPIGRSGPARTVRRDAIGSAGGPAGGVSMKANRTKAIVIGTVLAGGSAIGILGLSAPAMAFTSGDLNASITPQSPATLVDRGAAVDVPVDVDCTASFADLTLQVTERVGGRSQPAVPTSRLPAPVGTSGCWSGSLPARSPAPPAGRSGRGRRWQPQPSSPATSPATAVRT